MDTKKQGRRATSLERLEAQLLSGVKTKKQGEDPIPLSDEDKIRIKKEIATIKERLAGNKKVKKSPTQVVENTSQKEKWVIDIHSVHMAYTKRSERRKNKGKSRKKMKKVRNVSFVKSIDNKPGLIQAFRDGRMGLSPKTHSFRLRKIEEFTF